MPKHIRLHDDCMKLQLTHKFEGNKLTAAASQILTCGGAEIIERLVYSSETTFDVELL